MEVSNEDAPNYKGLWEIVTVAETLKRSATAEEQRKLKTREDLALATICLFLQIFKFM